MSNVCGTYFTNLSYFTEFLSNYSVIHMEMSKSLLRHNCKKNHCYHRRNKADRIHL